MNIKELILRINQRKMNLNSISKISRAIGCIPILMVFFFFLFSCNKESKEQKIPIYGVHDVLNFGKVRDIEIKYSDYSKTKRNHYDKIGWSEWRFSSVKIYDKDGVLVSETGKRLVYNDNKKLVYEIEGKRYNRIDTTKYFYRDGQLIKKIGSRGEITNYHYYPNDNLYVLEYLSKQYDDDPLINVHEYVDAIDVNPNTLISIKKYPFPYHYTRLYRSKKGIVLRDLEFNSSVYGKKIDTLFLERVYEYKYDSKGNWIEREMSIRGEPRYKVKRRIRYYESYVPNLSNHLIEDMWLNKSNKEWLHLQENGKFDFGKNTYVGSSGNWDFDLDNFYITLRYENKTEKYRLDWNGLDLEFIDKDGDVIYLMTRE